MSLLLEALKKAERAKEEAQRAARGEAPAEKPSAPGELKIEENAPPEPAKHVVTRNELPRISQPLEILTDDLAAKAAPAPEPKAPAAAPRPAPKPQAPGRDAGAEASDRAAAKKVFEAKFKEPNPRLPFYITVGVLAVFGVGTAGYFWYQLRPPNSMFSANPKPPAGEQPVVAQAAPAPAAAAAAGATPPAVPGLPSATQPGAAGSSAPPAGAAATPAPAAQTPVPVPAAPEAPAAPKPAPLVRPAIPRSAETSREVSVTRPAPQIHPKVASAYAAYNAGSLDSAREEYQQVLREDPANRDALLGMAAIDMRTGRMEAAEAAYQRLLQQDPRDPQANAALMALRGARMDPLAAESRVKSLIAAEPGAYELQFTLGNQLAQQGRWPEAQQAYFKAFSADPENADFAYNLAVSLDHLGLGPLALDYYRRSLLLAERRGAGFDIAAARARIAQLQR